MLHPSSQKREGVVRKTCRIARKSRRNKEGKNSFLDENSINLSMISLYGWSEKFARVDDYVLDVRFERTSIIATLCKDDFNAPMTFKGTLNKDVFEPCIKDFIAPTLNPGDIVVMDNCSIHRIRDILNPIYEKGTTLLFLPPYSPDLNPIKLAWAKMKSVLGMLKARTIDEMS